MRKYLAAALLLSAAPALAQQSISTLSPPVVTDRRIDALRDNALANDHYAWDVVEGLTTEVGQRLAATEAEARAQHGDAVKVYRSGFRPMLHALADSPQRSLFKLVCVGEEERVVGIHLLGEGADEILQGFAVALKRGLHKRDLDDTVAIHPTSAEELVLMP